MATLAKALERHKPRKSDVQKRKKDYDLLNIPHIVDGFNNQDPEIRQDAIEKWAHAITENPGEERVMRHFSRILEHLSDPNTHVMVAALDAYAAAAQANPSDPRLTENLMRIAEMFNDPDNFVRTAALKAWKEVYLNNPDHPKVKLTSKAYETARKTSGKDTFTEYKTL